MNVNIVGVNRYNGVTMPAKQEQIEVTSLQHSIKGRSLLLHLKKKDQIKDSAAYFGTKIGEHVRRSPLEILNPEEADKALISALKLIYWIAEKVSNLKIFSITTPQLFKKNRLEKTQNVP